MHKLAISFTILMSFMLMFTISGCSANSKLYSSNIEIRNFYKSNQDIFNEYIKTFDKNASINSKDFQTYFGKDVIIDDDLLSRSFYSIPDGLSNIGVTEIEYYDNCLHFTFNSIGDYYNAIYYSFDGSPAKECPIFVNNAETTKYSFRDIGNGIYVNGEKNTGNDWYKTENIKGNWYYWEVHLA